MTDFVLVSELSEPNIQCYYKILKTRKVNERITAIRLKFRKQASFFLKWRTFKLEILDTKYFLHIKVRRIRNFIQLRNLERTLRLHLLKCQRHEIKIVKKKTTVYGQFDFAFDLQSLFMYHETERPYLRYNKYFDCIVYSRSGKGEIYLYSSGHYQTKNINNTWVLPDWIGYVRYLLTLYQRYYESRKVRVVEDLEAWKYSDSFNLSLEVDYMITEIFWNKSKEIIQAWCRAWPLAWPLVWPLVWPSSFRPWPPRASRPWCGCPENAKIYI